MKLLFGVASPDLTVVDPNNLNVGCTPLCKVTNRLWSYVLCLNPVNQVTARALYPAAATMANQAGSCPRCNF